MVVGSFLLLADAIRLHAEIKRPRGHLAMRLDAHITAHGPREAIGGNAGIARGVGTLANVEGAEIFLRVLAVAKSYKKEMISSAVSLIRV